MKTTQPVSEGSIVITAHDLVHQDTVVTKSGLCVYPRINLMEQDCACPDSGLTMVPDCRTDPKPALTEQDCDTADGLVLVLEISATTEAVYYAVPTLHSDRLTSDFHLTANPLGQSGVVVLNEPAWDLLNAFQRPCALSEGVRLAGNPPDGLTAAQHLASLGLLEPVGNYRPPKPSTPQTLTAWLHVTNDCNLRCPYCYVHKTPDAMEIKRGQQTVDAVFRSALAHSFRRVKLKYAGGEAILHFPLVLALHDYARRLADEHNLELDGVVLSNGVALTNRMIEALQVRELRLMISLDGVGTYHDAHRLFANGRGSFLHVERALDRLAEHGFTPSISITVSNRNLQGLPDVVGYVLGRELPFTINFYRENECSASVPDLTYQDEEIIAAMKAAFTVIEDNLPPFSLLGALLDRARLDIPHDRPCGVGQSYLVIGQNGGVARCHMEMEQTVTDVSATDPLQAIRANQGDVQNMPVDEKEGCRDCTWRYWCAGGCPALTYRMTGRFDAKSPNCRIYKALFPEVLRLEGLRLLKGSGVLPN